MKYLSTVAALVVASPALAHHTPADTVFSDHTSLIAVVACGVVSVCVLAFMALRQS